MQAISCAPRDEKGPLKAKAGGWLQGHGRKDSSLKPEMERDNTWPHPLRSQVTRGGGRVSGM